MDSYEKLLGMMLVFCLLVGMPLLLTACLDKKGPPEGQLPTWKVGDKWVWTYLMDNKVATLTEKVIGEETVEGRDCYVIDMSFDPVISYTQDGLVSTVTSMKYWADKATTICGVKMESSGSYNGTNFIFTTTYSYKPWISLFPLKIGKEVKTENTTTQYFDNNQTGEPMVTNEKYKVDSKEDVTVSAGTFSCWKISIYDGADNIIITMWYSDQVKSSVKMIDIAANTLMELLSYSVN